MPDQCAITGAGFGKRADPAQMWDQRCDRGPRRRVKIGRAAFEG